VHAAEGVVEPVGRYGCEHDAAGFDLVNPNVRFHRKGWGRIGTIGEALQELQARKLPQCVRRKTRLSRPHRHLLGIDHLHASHN
jgi:hypothetical protein